DEKMYGPNADIVYWPKNRHWKSFKDISDSGSEKTIHGIQIYKNTSMIVFTHTNALAKDFRNKQNIRAQI
ncbi:8521_t:CDS:2, partial [Cetraspora pellucida]